MIPRNCQRKTITNVSDHAYGLQLFDTIIMKTVREHIFIANLRMDSSFCLPFTRCHRVLYKCVKSIVQRIYFSHKSVSIEVQFEPNISYDNYVTIDMFLGRRDQCAHTAVWAYITVKPASHMLSCKIEHTLLYYMHASHSTVSCHSLMTECSLK